MATTKTLLRKKRKGPGSGKPAPTIVENGHAFRRDPKREAKQQSSFDPEIFEEICCLLEDGMSLGAICRDNEWAPSFGKFFRWLEADDARADRYARARETQAHRLATETLEISDTETDPQRARNRIDARRWYAAKVAPKKYGEKLEIEHQVNQSFVDKFQKAKDRARKSRR